MVWSEKSVHYDLFVKEIGWLLAEARRQTARSVNAILTATYWEIGRRIVEYEQGGKARDEYGEHLLSRLAKDLMAEHGRGFSAPDAVVLRRLEDLADGVCQIRGTGEMSDIVR